MGELFGSDQSSALERQQEQLEQQQEQLLAQQQAEEKAKKQQLEQQEISSMRGRYGDVRDDDPSAMAQTDSNTSNVDDGGPWFLKGKGSMYDKIMNG